MSNLYAKNFSDADEVKTPPKARVEVVKLNNVNASKLVLEPGWKWSTCIKPTVGGDSCQAGHVGVVISGSMTVKHDDGSEITVGAGDAYHFYEKLLKIKDRIETPSGKKIAKQRHEFMLSFLEQFYSEWNIRASYDD